MYRIQQFFTNLCLYILFVTILLLPNSAYCQSYIETFGQNRQQYRKFDWKYFDTKHFRVYHYDKAGRQLGRYVAEEAENDIAVIENRLGGQFPKRFNIILYNSYEEYRQTNVGLDEELQVLENTKAGTVNLVGDKLVVYFTGKHDDIKHQIRTGMATVVMQRMIFGENFKKMVKNALLLNLPEWVTAGYISYLVDGWDAKTNSEWKSLLDAQPKTGFYELSEKYPELAGRAFWKFISNQYSPETVKNLLYALQNKTSMNKAMKQKENLGIRIKKTYDSCIKYYKNVYKEDAQLREKPNSKNGLISLKVPTKSNVIVKNITVSPRGSDVAFVEWENGEYKVYTQKTTSEQEKSVLLEGGIKDLTELPDPNYPMLTYSNTGNKLAIIFKKGFQTRLRIYNSQKSKVENYVIPKKRCDRILGMSFMEDDNKLIFSAIKKSQTDLFTFTIKGAKMDNITDDVWDDIAPVYISGGSRKGILFLSNRPKPNMDVQLGVNELPTGPLNIYFYNTTTKRKELLKCTDIKKGKISQPVQFGYDNFAYLYDSNGINNKYVVLFARDKHNIDSAYSVPVTNYASSIISHQYNIANNEAADVIQEKNKYKVYFHDLNLPTPKDSVKELLPSLLSVNRPEEIKKTKDLKAEATSKAGEKMQPEIVNTPIIKLGNAFQSEFEDHNPAPAAPKQPVQDSTKGKNITDLTVKAEVPIDSFLLTEMTDSAYLKMKPAKYRLSFKPDFFSVRLDNSTLFSQYQSYNNTGGQYMNPSLGALSTISLNELLENHRFTLGFQLPLNLQSATFFLQYQNFNRMVDWGLLFYHSQEKTFQNIYFVDQNGNLLGSVPYAFKSATDMVQADFSKPFNRITSLKFHTSFRQEELTPKAVDTISLNDLQQFYPVQYWSLNRLEYVFDNTISPQQNIRFGTRYKVYTEYMYELNNEHENCYNIGLDYRTYKKLYKNTIWATRIAYAHSDGKNEVQYQLGGVDGWVQPQSAENSMTAGTPGFIALATSLRGYDQDARKGNNFAVINTEIRLPIISTFLKRPVQSAILKNLQFVAFIDAGSAWSGFLPTASATAANYTFPNGMSNPSPTNNVFLNITVPNAYGLAVGYGAGLRSTLLGYFLRFDLGWNIDNPSKPVACFSLGTDF